jgi:hypothetical protein
MPSPNRQPGIVPASDYRASLSNTPVEVSSSRANFYGFLFENNHTAAVYVQVFDKLAANVTLGTTVPDRTFMVPASSSFGKDATDFPLIYCSTALTIACTATRTGAGAPGAALTSHIWYSNTP